MQQHKFVGRVELAEILGVSARTLGTWVARGYVPQGVSLGNGQTARKVWDASEVMNTIRSKADAADLVRVIRRA